MSVSKTGKLKGNTKYFAIKPRRTQYNLSSFSWSRVSNFSSFHVTINMALDWTLFLEEGAKLALLFTALSVSIYRSIQFWYLSHLYHERTVSKLCNHNDWKLYFSESTMMLHPHD